MLLGAYLQVMLTKRYTDHRNKLLEDTATLFDFRFSLMCSAINSVIYGFSISVVPFTVGFAYIVGAYVNTSDESKVYYSDYAEIFL